MDLTFNTIYKDLDKVFKNHLIDLGDIDFFDPWAIGMVALKAIENKDHVDKSIKLPKDENIQTYLKRMHFGDFISSLTYKDAAKELENFQINEYENDNIQEIVHCLYRDDFNARLESKIRRMFRHFGLGEEDEQMATALVGELGNNVFDHNEGVWPMDVRGAIIIAQSYPKLKKIEVLVADPGVGFLGSLKELPNKPDNDVEAIKLGLSGITGRVGEKRGNGLKTIQNWTINEFNGIIRIQSGNGLVRVDKDGIKEKVVNKILGTLAELVVYYK